MADVSISSEESVSHSRHRREQANNVPGEKPGARLRALLARTRPLEGNEVPNVYWQGRSLIEELALAYETETDYDWSLPQCATVLGFLGSIQPTGGHCICNDQSEVNATCGLHVLYEFIAARLRAVEVSHGQA
jgi:hypothetical protein